MCWVEVDGKEIPWEEYDKMQQAKKQKEWRELQEQTQQAMKLLGELGRAFTAFNQFLEDHPKVDIKVDLKMPLEQSGDAQSGDTQSADARFYELLKQRLGLADEAPRCMHVKADGIRCGSPRMKDGELCFAHQRMAQAQSLQQRLRNIEDANGVQMALSEVMAAANAERITEKKAKLLLYGLQTAMANAKHVTFHKSPKEMVTEETPVSRRESGDPWRAGTFGRVIHGQPGPSVGGSGDRKSKTDEPLMHEEQEPPTPMISAAEWLRWEEMDPDLKVKFMELDAEANRRWLAKKNAAMALTNGNGNEIEAVRVT